ncbi:MAG TPA: transcriptional regulator [Candidatus Blautia avicola]|uniref:Transcriptional regulator n=1 Tax=Candidatus Blautia avicola TaxID=2838483 RepID=A0A9D2QRI7_9FIRM|nr:transcriptional regulator [Candidatus Blautia avicola]
MSALQEEKPVALRLVIFIMREEDEKKLEAMLDSMYVPIWYQCRGQGTAPSEIMDIFGLGGTLRLLTIGLLPKTNANELLKKMDEKFSFHQKGKGVAFTIPITGLQTPMLQMLKQEFREDINQNEIKRKIEERIKGDMAEIHEKSKYNVIWVSVTSGYSDQVVDTAREAGAKGGTVMRGRRRNSEHVSQHFGISLQEEQDFVMIIVPKENKAQVMSAICSSCGLHSPAHGVLVSLPVDEVIGLEK